jgi:hypothetical protein
LARFARCVRLASFVFGVFHRHVDIVDAGNVAALAVSPVPQCRICGQPEACLRPYFPRRQTYLRLALTAGKSSALC